MKSEWVDWAVKHWYALVALPMILGGVLTITFVGKHERRTIGWHLSSLMLGGWPYVIKNWRNNASSHSRIVVLVGLLIMAALAVVGLRN